MTRLLSWKRLERWLGLDEVPLSTENLAAPSQSRRPLVVLLSLLAVVYAAEIVARSFLPLLLRDHPLLLVALDAHTHDLLLASVKVGAVGLVAVAVAWRFSVHLIYYFLGRWYGDQALRWLGRKSRLAALIAARTEQIFARFASLAVFLFSDDLVCLLAGSTGMSLLRFVVLHFSGTILRVTALVVFARYLHGSLAHVVSIIDSGAASLTVVFAAVAIGSAVVTAAIHRHRLRELAGFLRPGRAGPPASANSAAGEPAATTPPETGHTDESD